MTQRYLRPRVGELEDAAEALEGYAVRPTPWPTVPAVADQDEQDQESLVELSEEFGVGGPPGDRTQDSVIKSHVLYH